VILKVVNRGTSKEPNILGYYFTPTSLRHGVLAWFSKNSFSLRGLDRHAEFIEEAKVQTLDYYLVNSWIIWGLWELSKPLLLVDFSSSLISKREALKAIEKKRPITNYLSFYKEALMWRGNRQLLKRALRAAQKLARWSSFNHLKEIADKWQTGLRRPFFAALSKDQFF
jgi:predicted HAD superfamily hydrolase